MNVFDAIMKKKPYAIPDEIVSSAGDGVSSSVLARQVNYQDESVTIFVSDASFKSGDGNRITLYGKDRILFILPAYDDQGNLVDNGYPAWAQLYPAQAENNAVFVVKLRNYEVDDALSAKNHEDFVGTLTISPSSEGRETTASGRLFVGDENEEVNTRLVWLTDEMRKARKGLPSAFIFFIPRGVYERLSTLKASPSPYVNTHKVSNSADIPF